MLRGVEPAAVQRRQIVIGPVAHVVGLEQIIREILDQQGSSWAQLGRELGQTRRNMSLLRSNSVIECKSALVLCRSVGLDPVQVFEPLDPLGLIGAKIAEIRRLSGIETP